MLGGVLATTSGLGFKRGFGEDTTVWKALEANSEPVNCLSGKCGKSVERYRGSLFPICLTASNALLTWRGRRPGKG